MMTRNRLRKREDFALLAADDTALATAARPADRTIRLLSKCEVRFASRCRSRLDETVGPSTASKYIAWTSLRILAALYHTRSAGYACRTALLNSAASWETKIGGLSPAGAVRSIESGTVQATWMHRRRAAILVACVALESGGRFGTTPAYANDVVGRLCLAAVPSFSEPAYPLKASVNNRYLVDRENVPFLMVGDAPRTLIAKSSVDDAAVYVANRRHHGILRCLDDFAVLGTPVTIRARLTRWRCRNDHCVRTTNFRRTASQAGGALRAPNGPSWEPLENARGVCMTDQIVITEKTSQAKDVRAAVGPRYGAILPAEGHLFDLVEPEDVVPAWKQWTTVLLRPDGLYGTKPASGGNKSLQARCDP
jgi:hypothetical protein